jgi:hypothetical protein
MSGKADIARKNRRRGKQFQWKAAKLLGGKNVGGLGGEDVEHIDYSIEAKSRASFVGKNWMEQAEKNCPEGKIPLVLIHIRKDRHEDDLVMMRLKSFQKLKLEDKKRGNCDHS